MKSGRKPTTLASGTCIRCRAALAARDIRTQRGHAARHDEGLRKSGIGKALLCRVHRNSTDFRRFLGFDAIGYVGNAVVVLGTNSECGIQRDHTGRTGSRGDVCGNLGVAERCWRHCRHGHETVERGVDTLHSNALARRDPVCGCGGESCHVSGQRLVRDRDRAATINERQS